VTRRAVVTGVGVVAPGGNGAKAFWELLAEGRTATRAITLFDAAGFRSRIAAECDFEPDAVLDRERIARMDRYVQFGAAAALEALADAGWERESLTEQDAYRTAVTMGSAVGGTTQLEAEYIAASERGARWTIDHTQVTADLFRVFSPAALSAEVAELAGARGMVQTVSTGCTSGLDAIGYGQRLIEDGRADVVVAGAAESPISPITVACFDAIRATSARNDDPEHASRPFDLSRDGFVLGEGAAVLVLEEEGRARRRGARIRCAVGGFATRGNAYHMTGLTREGTEMAEAISRALDQARVNPEEIGYVNAHGSGTKQNDRHETAAVKTALGRHARTTWMSSIKSMVGHSLGAIGAIELAACVLAMDNGVVPPTANLHTPDPECDLYYVPLHARERRIGSVLSVGSGFGGFQSAVVLTPAGSAL
jgi:minimal PKS ketosynthase (KS/KS alpha)